MKLYQATELIFCYVIILIATNLIYPSNLAEFTLSACPITRLVTVYWSFGGLSFQNNILQHSGKNPLSVQTAKMNAYLKSM